MDILSLLTPSDMRAPLASDSTGEYDFREIEILPLGVPESMDIGSTSPRPWPSGLESQWPRRSTPSGRGRWPAAPPALPFQFAGLDALDEAVKQALHRGRFEDGLRQRTCDWWSQCYVSFRKYLVANSSDRAMLDGHVARQVEVLTRWVGWLRQRDVTHVTVNSYWRGVTLLFERITRATGMLNPFRLLRTPRASRPQPRAVTRATAEATLRWVRNARWRSRLERTRNLAVVGCFVLAGLRRNEVLTLDRADVHIDRGTFTIRRGKGTHGGKDRTAYMTAQLRLLLADYEEERDRAGRTHPEFFTAIAANAPMTVMMVRRVFRILSAGLELRLSPHMLRHTYATLLRQAGVPDRVAMDLMGHTSLAMLERYSRVFDGEHAQEANKLRLDVDL